MPPPRPTPSKKPPGWDDPPAPPTPARDLAVSVGALLALSGFFLLVAYKVFRFVAEVIADEKARGWTPKHADKTDLVRGQLPLIAWLSLFVGAVLLLTACRTIYRWIRHRPLLQDGDFASVPFDQTDYSADPDDQDETT